VKRSFANHGWTAHSESVEKLVAKVAAPAKFFKTWTNVGDLPDPNALQQLQAKLFAGEQSRRCMRRSP
jgi:hypothetical protein